MKIITENTNYFDLFTYSTFKEYEPYQLTESEIKILKENKIINTMPASGCHKLKEGGITFDIGFTRWYVNFEKDFAIIISEGC